MIPARGKKLQEDAGRFVKLERAIIAALLGVALLTFFFPLLIIHVPIAGDQSITGYDVFTRANQFQQQVQEGSSPMPGSPHTSESSTQSVPNKKAQSAADVPRSLKNAWTMPLLIFAAFICAALALISVFAYTDATSALGIVGGLCGVLAIVNVAVIGSDFKTWLAQSTKESLKDNPFAGIGTLMFNSIELRVGISLYVLTLCLFLTAFLLHTGILSRIRLDSR
jgi:hypothetical protein